MGYSYWSPLLSPTIHVAEPFNHVPYSVTLGSKGQMISHLCTRAQKNLSVFLNRRTTNTNGPTLCRFPGLFDDYTQPIIFSHNT